MPLPSAPDPLVTARAEYAQVLALSAELQRATAELRTREDELESLVVAAGDGSKDASESSKDAASALSAIAPFQSRLVADAKKANTPASQQSANTATAKREQAKALAADAKKAAAAADADAKQITSLAKLGPVSGYVARKARLAKDDAKLGVQASDAQLALADLEAKAQGKSFCDLRKVDFKNLKYSFGKLRNGSYGSCEIAGCSTGVCFGTPDSDPYSLEQVDYADLDADGAPEAIVTIDSGGCGHASVVSVHVYVFGGDAKCGPKPLGTIDIPMNCANAKVVGRSIVVDSTDCGSGDPKQQWGLVGGQLRQQR